MTVPTPTEEYLDLSIATFTENGSPADIDDQHTATSAFIFDGINDWLTSSEKPSVLGDAVVSVSFWMKTSDIVSGSPLGQRLNSLGVGDGTWDITINNGSISLALRDGNNTGIGDSVTNTLASTVGDGNWHLVTATGSVVGGTVDVNIYLDGVELGYVTQDRKTGTITAMGSSGAIGSLTIGALRPNGFIPFDGSISRVKVWRQVLTDAEVLEEYQNECISTTLTDYIGYWRLDEANTATALDSSGNSFHGTSSGTPSFSTDTAPTLFANPRSFSFDGVNDFVDVTAHVANFPSGAAARTISIWTNRTDDKRLFAYGKDTGSGGKIQIEASDGRFEVLFIDHSWGLTGLSLSGWNNFIVVVPDGAVNTDDILMYINGSKIAAVTTAGSPQVLNTVLEVFYIGATIKLQQFFEGKIDDVRFYDRALTLGQICGISLGAGLEPSNNGASVFPESIFSEKIMIPIYSNTLFKTP